jgi:subtilase family serine protease
MITRSMKSAVLSLAIVSLGVSTPGLLAAEKAILQSRVAATERVGFDVYLPLQHRDQVEKMLRDLHDSNSPNFHKWLTPTAFNARFAAPAGQISAIQRQLGNFGLQTSIVGPQRIHVTGSATSVEQALGTVLKHGTYKNGKAIVVATQPLLKPEALTQAHAVVTGLTGTIRIRTHAHRMAPQNRYSAAGSYWFDDLKQAYSYPSYKSLTGAGVTIGILGSGDFNAPDMDMYFSHEKLATPSFTTINVDGGAPFDVNNSFETHLDLQQSGGMAPGAKVLFYNIPDLSDASVIGGLAQIVYDNRSDVVSMSFGAPEAFYTAADNGGEDITSLLQVEDDLMAQGTAQGITFIASSGDAGALSAVPPGCLNGDAQCGSFEASAEFPASSPHVTGVGGTNLKTTFFFGLDNNSAYVSEQAYADPLAEDIFYGTSATGGFWGSGGGDSILFPKPDFQQYTDTGNPNFRTVPDLALHMGGCPVGTVTTCSTDDSSDLEVIGGQIAGVIGTSASAPDFAGLTALAIQHFGGRLGNENYYIYTLAFLQNFGLPVNVFKTNIPGNNGLYSTTPKGYNRVLGNGTVNGVNFLFAPFNPVAGTPQTPSNP